jgi:hypothetical protein
LAGELERPGYCGERRDCFLAAVSAVIFWVSKIVVPAQQAVCCARRSPERWEIGESL